MIDFKQKIYLLGQQDLRPRLLFFMLPKIHKDLEQWSKPHKIPPGRFIVSDSSIETYYTADYIDYYLHPLSITYPCYKKDMYDFFKMNPAVIPIYNGYQKLRYSDITQGIAAVRNCFCEHLEPKTTVNF